MRVRRGTLLGVAFLFLAACGTSPSLVPATPTIPPTVPPSPAPTAPARPTPSPTPFPFAAIDGLLCSGTWTNHTFEASGKISIAFDLSRSASIVLEVGGHAFGASGGRLDLPVTISGDTFAIDGDFGFLGTLAVKVKADGTVRAVITDPPALGSGFSVKVTKFSLKDGRLAIESKTYVNGAALARSTVGATCVRSP